ncbi:hypothetical protein ABZ721_11980 [Streptomyces sp. NPDC006733]|uniref:hypothetical protein n=1 Tax=Streptomyces sp. NPDC006733 TaxID=3155460 RepID=UPI0033E2D76D
MGGLLPFLIAAGCLGAIMGFLWWVAAVARRRGVAGTAFAGALAAYNEAYRITSYESHCELRAQADRKSPVRSPDDPWQRSLTTAQFPDARGPQPRVGAGRRRKGLRQRMARFASGVTRPHGPGSVRPKRT